MSVGITKSGVFSKATNYCGLFLMMVIMRSYDSPQLQPCQAIFLLHAN